MMNKLNEDYHTSQRNIDNIEKNILLNGEIFKNNILNREISITFKSILNREIVMSERSERSS